MNTENNQMNNQSDENEECKHCGWMCEFMQCHIEFNPSCKYIQSKYIVTRDDDGELCWIPRKKTVRKKCINTLKRHKF